jgi:hypothetical protein
MFDKELGKRHVAHQCQPHHWPMVGVALCHTLDTVLGEKFTPEVQDAWTILYNFLGFHMIEGFSWRTVDEAFFGRRQSLRGGKRRDLGWNNDV